MLVGRIIDDQGQRVEDQHDLPRNEQERALIGDPRNDENTFVSQLHLLFIKFHNKVVDKVMSARPELEDDDLLKEVQRIVRWHYQWVVIFDFLKRTIPVDMLGKLLVRDGLLEVQLKFYRPKPRPFMPVEFSVAAYRFGHSQVRGGYNLNRLVSAPTFRTANDLAQQPNPRIADFRGFSALPPRWTASWSFFFDGLDVPEGPQDFLQQSLKIDTNIARPLATALPDTDHSDPDDFSLPRRNLIRGKRLGLPSGQWMAKRMGVPNDRILTGPDLFPEQSEVRKFLEERIDAKKVDTLGANIPLWYYVLKEAEVQQNGERLGDVGGRIVAEVLLGLLDSDPLSFLSVQPNWEPELAEGGEFKMADLIRFADPAAAEFHDGVPHEQGQNGGQG